MRLDASIYRCVRAARRNVEGRARRWSSRVRAVRRTYQRRLAYMRYVGQGHEITVAAAGAGFDGSGRARACARSSRRNIRCCSKRPIPGAAIEVLSWSVLVSTDSYRPEKIAKIADKRAGVPDGSRAFFDGRAGKTIDVPLYRRINIEAGRARAGSGDHRRGRNLDIHHGKLRCAHRTRPGVS